MSAEPKNNEDRDAIVYIVDDDPSVRAGLADLLASVGLNALSFPSAIHFMSFDRPDLSSCLVLDVRMPGPSGLDFQDEMAAQGIVMPTVFITGHGDIPMSVRAMKAGAVEFLTKPFRDQDLLDAIEQGLLRDKATRQGAEVLSVLLERYETLNHGEKAVMDLVVAGLLNKQIAAELSLSEITIKVRRGQVMRKMGASSLANLVRYAGRIDGSDQQALKL